MIRMMNNNRPYHDRDDLLECLDEAFHIFEEFDKYLDKHD